MFRIPSSALAVTLLACSSAPSPRAAPTIAVTAPPETSASPAASPATPEPSAPVEPDPPRSVALDLLTRRGESERRVDGALTIDFGGPAGAKYTLGGWSTRVREAEVDGVHALVSTGTAGNILFSSESGPAVIDLRMRAFRAGRVTVYVDGDTVGGGAIGTEFEDFRFELESLDAGEHSLRVRVSRTSRTRELGRVGFALDTLRVAQSSEETAVERVSDVRTILPTASVRWPVVLPEGARLEVRADAPVSARVLRDGAPPSPAGEGSEFEFEVDGAGDIVWVELSAPEGARLERAQITVPLARARALTRPTNVLLVLIDTLRADALQPYQATSRVQTPRLLDFVGAATTFDHAHSQENWTKPSIATLLTSQMPWEHGATQHESVLPRSATLLPEVLKEHGFETASFICNGFVSDRFGFRQGWDRYRNYIREGRRTRSQFVAADVLEWLDARQEERSETPFFLYVHTIDPHVPYRAPRDFVAMYGDADYRGVVDFSRDATLLENVKLGNVRLRENDRAHLRALYDAEVSYHDVHFGAILDGLERRGLDESTLVIVTSDHGEEFWDHGSVGHGHSVYEELLHVPMFVRIPGEAPRRVSTPVGLVDVMPTILEALELPIPEGLSGRSFLGALRGETLARGTVSGFMENWRTFTVGRWKLIERPGNRSAVYDLREDPGETQDLVAERPLTRRALRAWMGMRLAETRSNAPARRRARPADEPPIDEETAAQLRALGYIVD